MENNSTMQIIPSHAIINRWFGAINLHVLLQSSVKFDVEVSFPLFPWLIPHVVAVQLRSGAVRWAHHLAHSFSMRGVSIGELDEFISWVDNHGGNFFNDLRGLLDLAYLGFVDLDGFFDLGRVNKETNLALDIGAIQRIHLFQPRQTIF